MSKEGIFDPGRLIDATGLHEMATLRQLLNDKYLFLA